jgi:plasmid stabilization system protein ParE
MTNTLTINQFALEDMQNALDWYENQSIGSEQKFHKAIDEILKFIQKYPEAAAPRYRQLRYKALKKFPYYVLYLFDEAQGTIEIVAILHDRQDRKTWKTRL